MDQQQALKYVCKTAAHALVALCYDDCLEALEKAIQFVRSSSDVHAVGVGVGEGLRLNIRVSVFSCFASMRVRNFDRFDTGCRRWHLVCLASMKRPTWRYGVIFPLVRSPMPYRCTGCQTNCVCERRSKHVYPLKFGDSARLRVSKSWSLNPFSPDIKFEPFLTNSFDIALATVLLT